MNKLSICIPVFNGEEFIKDTVDSLILQAEKNKVSLVIIDDNSTDNSFKILSRYHEDHSIISLIKNDSTIGMDKNFSKVINFAKTEYVWFFGQDDILLDGAIEKLLNVINDNSSPDLIYFNYKQMNHNMDETICSSYLNTQLLSNKKINGDKLFNGKEEYFKYLESLPTFLPAIVFKKELWEQNIADKFLNTHYVQVGMMNMMKYDLKILVISKPYIHGRIPNNKWQTDGSSLFSVLLGYQKMLYLSRKENALPEHIYRLHLRRYILNYFFMVYNCKRMGLIINEMNLSDLDIISDNNLVRKIYFTSILKIPFYFHIILYYALYSIKKVGLFFLKRLRIKI